MVTGLVVSCLFVLLFLPSLVWSKPTVHAAPAKTLRDQSSNASPNIITSGLFSSTDGLQKVAGSIQTAMYDTSRSIRNSVTAITAGSIHFLYHGTASTVSGTAHLIAASASFVGHLPTKTYALVANAGTVGSIITPADYESSATPTITSVIALSTVNDNHLPTVKTATVTTTATPQPPVPAAVQWPIRGVVTLEFGMSDWPYELVHTGMDISDGQYSGVTPVHPFKPGTVIAVIHSNYGFGNHVVVDHGNGVTSLYGHLYSTSVVVGQSVDQTTILGYEGTTGASTGVHVHFEIDVNGRPTNPRLYVNGSPS